MLLFTGTYYLIVYKSFEARELKLIVIIMLTIVYLDYNSTDVNLEFSK